MLVKCPIHEVKPFQLLYGIFRNVGANPVVSLSLALTIAVVLYEMCLGLYHFLKLKTNELDVLDHSCTTSTQEADTGGLS